MRRRTIITSAILAMALFASPATANIQPTFRTENVYFTCPGPTKLHQANWIPKAAGQTTNPSWRTAEPSGSVQSGAGCGSADWGGTSNELYSPVFQGTFTGNLQSMTVRIHQLLLGNARSGSTETLRLFGDIDGVPIFPAGAQPNHGRTVTVTPVDANSGVTEVFEFTITNLGFAEDITDENGNVVGTRTGGAATENGDGAQERTITLGLGLHGTALSLDPAAPAGHKAGFFVWDTTEVPSGITFNPATPAAATVAADLPE